MFCSIIIHLQIPNLHKILLNMKIIQTDKNQILCLGLGVKGEDFQPRGCGFESCG